MNYPNKFFVSVLLGASLASWVMASEPIRDKDGFEGGYIKCALGGFVPGCFSGVLSGHFDPWFKNQEKYASDVEGFYRSWLGGNAVYKVHVANKEVKAGVFDNRSYLVERSDGEVAGLYVGYRNVKGQWYIYDVKGGSSDEFVRLLLKMPEISVGRNN